MPLPATHPEMQQRIEDAAVESVMLRSRGIWRALMGDDGQAANSRQLVGADFLAFYNDLVSHEETFPIPMQNPADPEGEPVIIQAPAEVRTMEHLEVVNPKLAEQYHREAERQIAKLAS